MLRKTTRPETERHRRLVVCVLQDVLKTGARFESYAELKTALKIRLARLRISYDAGVVAEALDQLERGGVSPLVNLR